jgi:hypothetical protein
MLCLLKPLCLASCLLSPTTSVCSSPTIIAQIDHSCVDTYQLTNQTRPDDLYHTVGDRILLCTYSFPISSVELIFLYSSSLQVYHVHIRSTSHLQKLMGGERKSSVDQSTTSSAPPDGNANAPKGPNYCHVCCFDFANSEVIFTL